MRETQLITTSETATVIAERSGRSCGPENVRRLAREGKLTVATTVGNGQRLFNRADVERFARERANRIETRSMR